MKIVKSCIICSSDDMKILLDLGDQPLANALLEDASQQALLYPLVLSQCKRCLHGQISTQLEPSLLFSSDYPFLAGQSISWVKHCEEIVNRLVEYVNTDSVNRIIDIGSNDGTLLFTFERLWGSQHRLLGVDPSDIQADYTLQPTTWEEAEIETGSARVITATNVLAHTSNPHAFISKVCKALAPNGVFYLEVPDFSKMLMTYNFTSIYHEHYSYFTLTSLLSLLISHQLWPIQIIESPMHGGSIGIIASKDPLLMSDLVISSKSHLYCSSDFHIGVGVAVKDLLTDLLSSEEPVYGYGASAKATVLLNYINDTQQTLDPSFNLSIRGVFDSAPTKIGRFIPGVDIPIYSPADIDLHKPATILILSPNIKDDIIFQAKRFGFTGSFIMLSSPV